MGMLKTYRLGYNLSEQNGLEFVTHPKVWVGVEMANKHISVGIVRTRLHFDGEFLH